MSKPYVPNPYARNSETQSSVWAAREVVEEEGGGTGDPAAIAELRSDVTELQTDVAAKADKTYVDTEVSSLQAQLNALPEPSGIQFPQARGAVVFTWDDGWDSHDDVAQMHADRGQKATFYITSNLLGTSQHLPSSALAGILAQGHEIGCHSADHTDMKAMTSAQRATQWASQQTIEGIIGQPVTSYAYPLGNNDLTCNQEAYGRFDRVAAIGLSQGYYTGSSGYAPWLYDADFEGFKHGRFPWSQSTHAQFMALLKDHVRRRPIILTAYAHQVGNADTPTLSQVQEAMDYCQANGIPCLTARDALPGPKVVNPGFEGGLDGWTVINAGAATSGTTVDVIDDTPAAGLPGAKSLRIVSPNTTTTSDSVHVFQTLPAKPNTSYTLSARIRHSGLTGTIGGTAKYSVRLNEFNSQGGSVSGRSVRGNASSDTWGQSTAAPTATDIAATLAGKTHPDTRYVTVGLYVQELQGTFYADHVHFGQTLDGLLG